MHWYDEGWAQLLFLFSGLGALMLFAILSPKPPPVRRIIRVSGRVCDVVFVKTGEQCTEGRHRECHDVGYDEARCPP
jgi:hypothetical protein